MKFKHISLFFIFILTIATSNAQRKITEESLLIDSINRLAYTINYGENDIVKLNANELLIETFYSTLNTKEKLLTDFDSIKNISIIIPTDKAFKLFTWGIKKEDGSYECFGVLQTINPKTGRNVIFTLKDKTEMFFSPENNLGEADNWFGAIYYKVLPSTINKKKYYTLLGWNGFNNVKQIKVIDVLSFKANGTPVFGSKIFKKYTNHNAVRVVFEYSKSASMTLIYDTQTYKVNTNKRDPKTKRMITQDIKSDMIVFDRLAPLNESMDGVREYYVPETNIMDAFIPYQGRWSYVPDIEARNHAKKSDKTGPKINYNKRKHYTPPTKKTIKK